MKGLNSALVLLAGLLVPPLPRGLGQLPQNPSPMVENTRRHERLPETEVKGKRFEMPVGNLLLTPEAERRDRLPLTIHFQGQPWVAEYAATRRKSAAAVITAYLHSTIFPGTFASTTETADYLLEQLGLRRRPVLKWGPLGMQQISHVRKGRFEMLGFAGNSAPDHIDQYHALETWLRRIKL